MQVRVCEEMGTKRDANAKGDKETFHRPLPPFQSSSSLVLPESSLPPLVLATLPSGY